MKKRTTIDMVLSGLFLALGLLMPFLTAQIPELGQSLLPMHIPVLLCGFICGWPWGLAVGAVTPLLRSLIFGMPLLFPMAVVMAFELAAYGALAGLFYKLLPKKSGYVYLSLILAMIGGRIVWGIAAYLLFGIVGTAVTWQFFASAAFVTALPGIALQILLVPLIVIGLRRTNLIRTT